MAQALQCEPLALSTGRSFWTTKVDACGVSDACKVNTRCGTPGLSLQFADNGVTLATDQWVASIALNMLLTDARRRDTRCGWAPGTLNGHWSESFTDNGSFGSHVRYTTAQASVRDSMLLIKAEVQSTLQKLVDYGIAVEVKVEATYAGNGIIQLDIEIFGSAIDPTRIGMTATRNENAWVWGA